MFDYDVYLLVPAVCNANISVILLSNRVSKFYYCTSRYKNVCLYVLFLF
jgi:hypothetical protein